MLIKNKIDIICKYKINNKKIYGGAPHIRKQKGEMQMKIMYVCTGNICRSAMAEAILKKEGTSNNLNLQVYSSGIFAQDLEPATENSIKAMEKYNINLNGHKATNVKNANMDQMDLILCMTIGHKQLLTQMYPQLKEKIYTFKEYIGNNQDLDINDPWGGSLEIYNEIAEQIYECTKKLIEKLQNIQ